MTEQIGDIMTNDTDLVTLSRDELIGEVLRLRNAIRVHRDSSGHDLCWFHPDLWRLLPEQSQATPSVPPWPQFMRGCVAYRASLDAQLQGAEVDPCEYAQMHDKSHNTES